MVNPIASLVETTVRDVPHSPVLGPDGSLAMLVDDVRRTLHELAATASTEDLVAAWHAAPDVRAWALDLCAQAEAELAAGAPGDATMEWWISRQLPAGLPLLNELRTRTERAAATALSALGLLLQREQFAELDRVQPGCQWDLAQTPGFLPPPARPAAHQVENGLPLPGPDLRTVSMNPNGPAVVRTTAEQFPDAARVPSSHDLSITPQVLAHALFVSGRAPGHRHRHGRSSTYEFIHRVAAIPAYLHWTRKGIKRTALALELDPTEKGMLSYTLGQAMCQVFAEHLLSVRFFMHVSRYADAYGLTFSAGQSRADFFGPRYSGTWVVAEAKGRSGPLDKETRQAMEAQKRTVKTVSSKVPEISYACAVDFPSPSGAMRLTAIDPEEAEPGAVDLPVDLDLFALAYYTPFLDAFAHQPPRLLGDYVVAGLQSVGVTLGLLAPVLQRIERAVRLEDTSGLYGDVTRLLDRYTARYARESTTLFADGTLFAADWNHRPDQLRRERPEPAAEQMRELHEFYRMADVQDGPSREESMREEDWNWRDLPPATGDLPGLFPPVDIAE